MKLPTKQSTKQTAKQKKRGALLLAFALACGMTLNACGGGGVEMRTPASPSIKSRL